MPHCSKVLRGQFPRMNYAEVPCNKRLRNCFLSRVNYRGKQGETQGATTQDDTWNGEGPHSVTGVALACLPSPTKPAKRALRPARANAELPCRRITQRVTIALFPHNHGCWRAVLPRRAGVDQRPALVIAQRGSGWPCVLWTQDACYGHKMD